MKFRKYRIILLCIFMLTGCVSKKTDTFEQEYGVSGIDAVELKDSDDVMEKMTNGTHVVLFAHPDEDQKKVIEVLAEAVKQYAGVRIYYYDLDKVQNKLGGDIIEMTTPWISNYPFSMGPVIYFIRNGEVVDWQCGKEAVLDFNEVLTLMTSGEKPACSGGC